MTAGACGTSRAALLPVVSGFIQGSVGGDWDTNWKLGLPTFYEPGDVFGTFWENPTLGKRF